MKSTQFLHYDMMGTEIATGQYAASFNNNSLELFMVNKINPKMITLKHRKRDFTVLRYPKDLIVLSNEEVMLKLLKE